MTCQVNPEGRQQHLSSQGDEHHDEEQAQFVAGHRHQKARAVVAKSNTIWRCWIKPPGNAPALFSMTYRVAPVAMGTTEHDKAALGHAKLMQVPGADRRIDGCRLPRAAASRCRLIARVRPDHR